MLGRWIAALCLLCAAFAPAASAQALPGICIESSSSLMPFEREEPRQVDQVDVDADVALPSPVRDEELPWCASDDDPRCAPLHGGSAPSSAGVRISPAIELFVAKPEPIASADHEFMPHAGLLPSAGTATRLERPPRIARRSL